MKQFYLAEIITRDKLVHQGVFFKPDNEGKLSFANALAGKRALLWIHGLTSNFYSNLQLLELFVKQCDKSGFGFAAFNNRGHDIVTNIKKIDPREPKGYGRINGGAGYEVFTDCVHDIEAGIDFLVSQGFSEIILIGHSTGANKVCYYAGSIKHPHIAGVILASPVSDRLDPSLNQQKLKINLVRMQKLIRVKKGDELGIGYHVFPVTPKRFVSSFKPGMPEDVFDYGDIKPKLTAFKKIKQPLLILLGENDEYLDRPAKDVLTIFDRYHKSKKYRSEIITDALHGYNGQEQKFVSSIINWVNSL